MLAGAGEARLMDACGNLIVHDKVTNLVTLAHSTVKQYLIESDANALESRIKISQIDAERYICELCMVYLDLKEFDGAIVKNQPPLIMRSNALPGATKVNTTNDMLVRLSKGQFKSSPSKSVNIDLRNVLKRAQEAHAMDTEAFRLLDYVKTWWLEHAKVLDGEDHAHKLWATFKHITYDRQCTFSSGLGSRQAWKAR